jgi:Ca2+-binding RTX toxin-like protein
MTTYNLTTAGQLTNILGSLKSPAQADYIYNYLNSHHFVPSGRHPLTVVVEPTPELTATAAPNVVGTAGGAYVLQGTHELFLFDGQPGQTAYVTDTKGGNVLADPGNITYNGPTSGKGGDTLIGGDGSTMTALQGNDLLLGGVGASTLIAGSGKDTLQGTGQTLMEGGSGKDSLYGGASASAQDTLVAGTGNDLMQTKQGNNTFYTGSGNDTIKTGTGMDSVYAGLSGNATVTGSASGQTTIYESHTASDIASEKTKHGVTTVTFNDGSKLVYSHATVDYKV